MDDSMGDGAFDRFRNHVRDNLDTGLEAQRREAKYISRHKLQEYWRHERVSEIVSATECQVPIDDILGQYLQIFSILIWISKTGQSYVRYLNLYNQFQRADISLPHLERPAFLSSDRDFDNVWPSFFEHQWRFCPVALPGPQRIHDRRLHPRQVLPLRIMKTLGHAKAGRQAKVELAKIQLHAKPCPPGASSSPLSDHVVLKSYTPNYDRAYRNEMKAFASIWNAPPSRNILSCLGSYHTDTKNGGTTYNIILEYADKGTLLDIYHRNHPPVTFEEIKAFWSGIFYMVKALMIVQNAVPEKLGSSCIHQDIKPSNIFAFSRDEKVPSEHFESTFKIGDFGESSVVRSSPYHYTGNARDNRSTRTYCPPELHWGDEVDLRVGPLVDIWSLGCVLIEAAVWVAFGERTRLSFQQMRREENAKVAPTQRSLGRSDCFHNGNARLQVVSEVYDLLIRNGRRCDELTPQIVRLVLDHVLVNDSGRYDARTLSSELDNLIQKSTETVHDQNMRETSTSSAGLNQASPFDSTNAPPRDNSKSYRTGIFGSYTFTESPSIGSPASPSGASGTKQLSKATQADSSLGISYVPGSSRDFQGEFRQSLSPSPTDGGEPLGGLQYMPEYTPHPSIPHVEVLSPVQRQTYQGPSRKDTIETMIYSPSEGKKQVLEPTRSTSTFPRVTIAEVNDRKVKEKEKKFFYLRGEDEAMPLLQNRNHMFLIDNSMSMQAFKEQAIDTFTALSHLLDKADEDGLEVVCTSDLENIVRDRRTDNLVSFVRRSFQNGDRARCFIEQSLQALIRKVIQELPSGPGEGPRRSGSITRFIKKRSNKGLPTSIYILTNGVWDSSPAAKDGICGADRPIVQLIQELQKRNLHHSQVSLQFIRFGNDETGIRRLTHLDDDLARKYPDFDIVDHKECTSSVWPMLVGSLDEGTDHEDHTSEISI